MRIILNCSTFFCLFCWQIVRSALILRQRLDNMISWHASVSSSEHLGNSHNHCKIVSTIKVNGKCNSCQLAKNTRALCVIIDVIVSSAGRDLLVGPLMHERSLKKNKRVMQFIRWSCRNNTIFIFVGSRQPPAKIQEVTLMRPFHGNLHQNAKDWCVLKWTLWCSWSASALSVRRQNVLQVVSKASTACLLGDGPDIIPGSSNEPHMRFGFASHHVIAIHYCRA